MDMNKNEMEVLNEFRVEIKGIIEDVEDYFLIRWLRARNFDLKKAKEMLLNYLEWIKSNKNLPIIHNWTPPKCIVEYFKYKFIGKDHDGRPIIWVPMGRYNIKTAFQEGLKENTFRYAYQIMDEILAAIKISHEKSNVDKFVGLLDMAELSLHKLNADVLQCALRFFRELEAYYPELIHSIYIINAPYIFSLPYNMVKPILSSTTISKLKIFDSNEKKWKPILFENFPCHVIPLEYGGTGPEVLSDFNY